MAFGGQKVCAPAHMRSVQASANNLLPMSASGYALFSGLVFIAVMEMTVVPITHLMLHKFHVDDKDLSG
jgi:hypothetical protein